MSSQLAAHKLDISHLTVRFGTQVALRDVSLQVLTNEILAVIGPSNSGKSSLLLALNRMVDRVPQASVEGSILLDGADVASIQDVQVLRRRIGMGRA
jgi:phosphate transport system ATP-binding protein